MSKIYLAGKMGGLTKNEAQGWRKWVKDTYPQFEYLDPTEVEETSSQGIYDVRYCDHQSIYRKDIELLKKADFVLAVVNGGEFGTIWEIGYADCLEINLMVVSSDNYISNHPFILASRPRHWAASTPNLSEAMGIIKCYTLCYQLTGR